MGKVEHNENIFVKCILICEMVIMKPKTKHDFLLKKKKKHNKSHQQTKLGSHSLDLKGSKMEKETPFKSV